MIRQSLMAKGSSVAVRQIGCSKVFDFMLYSDFADDVEIWRLIKNTRHVLEQWPGF